MRAQLQCPTNPSETNFHAYGINTKFYYDGVYLGAGSDESVEDFKEESVAGKSSDPKRFFAWYWESRAISSPSRLVLCADSLDEGFDQKPSITPASDSKAIGLYHNFQSTLLSGDISVKILGPSEIFQTYQFKRFRDFDSQILIRK